MNKKDFIILIGCFTLALLVERALWIWSKNTKILKSKPDGDQLIKDMRALR